jgi:hypothetical protein
MRACAGRIPLSLLYSRKRPRLQSEWATMPMMKARLLQLGKRPLLTGAHQPAVAGDIGSKNRG